MILECDSSYCRVP